VLTFKLDIVLSHHPGDEVNMSLMTDVDKLPGSAYSLGLDSAVCVTSIYIK